MKEVWQSLTKWRGEGKRTALVTVIGVEGAALRSAGSKMAISSTGEIEGSVSGGCVEGAVFEEAQEVLRSGNPKILSYGVSDESAWEAMLTCGGSIRLLVRSMDSSAWQQVLADVDCVLANNELAALATVVAGSLAGTKMLVKADGSMPGASLDAELRASVLAAARECWQKSMPAVVDVNTSAGTQTVFIDILMPPQKLIIIGAVHIAMPLVQLARVMGFRTIIIDPRAAFVTRERFPDVDELHKQWPDVALADQVLDQGTYVVCLSHDEKIDIPALRVALESDVRYIGVLGSKKTHAHRLQSMRELDIPEATFDRIHAPIGLPIGRREPEEIALSIMAEIIAVKNGL